MNSKLIKPGLTAERALLAVFYGRVSQDRSHKRKSVREQAGEARERADERGWRLPENAVFVDTDRSASRFARKPRVGWEALLAYLGANPVDVLILWESSRGERRMGPWVALLDLCRDRGIGIYVIKDDALYDPSNHRDRKALLSEGIENEAESEKTSQRIRRDKTTSARDGRPPGRLNYGHRRVYNEHREYVETVPHESQAPIKVELIDDAIVAQPTANLSAIARDLNERRDAARAEAARTAWALRHTDVSAARIAAREGHRYDAPAGGRWSPHQVRLLALNPVYLGHRVAHGEITKRDVYPVITPQWKYDLIAAKLNTSDRRRHGGGRLAYQLAGAARCGLCGGAIRTGHANQYRCTECWKVNVQRDLIDGFIDTLIVQRLRMPNAHDVFRPASNGPEIEEAKREKKELEEALEDARAQWKARKISAASFADFESHVSKEIADAEKRIRKLSTPPALAGLDPLDIANRWPDLSVHVRREVLLGLADVVILPAEGRRKFNPWRLRNSRWHGEEATWGEMIGLRFGDRPVLDPGLFIEHVTEAWDRLAERAPELSSSTTDKLRELLRSP